MPDKHFKMIRYSGLFVTRWKQRYVEQARRALGQPPEPSVAESTPVAISLMSWQDRQRAQGEDPLRCTVCDQPMVLIEIAFGPHDRTERFFQRAGRPIRVLHPAYAMPP